LTRPRFVLTPRQLDVLWHDLDLGRLPYPLDVPSVGDTVAERGRQRAEVLAELGGHPAAALTALLRLLADHDVAVDAVAHIGRPVRAIAASDHQHAVLAVLDEGAVGVAEIRPTALAKSIVDILPARTGGPGNARTLPVETLRRAVTLYEDREDHHGDDPWGNDELDERAALTKAGLSNEDAKAVAELAASRVAGGQFGMSRSDGGRSPTLITWFDTHQGRYLMVRDDQWLSIAPADNERITARVADVLVPAP
jgi:EspG family